ncbi:ABC transporter substrate-binding protein [Roseomonas stagni]|uniref:ABC transporter substrate-binding protein n=1 Tax=Falsiroseomonas algicola TaxID=2716930 RepID=A0A6M1LEV6_9PROT|nr:ABC transporter substrate-binding protein [Falsiroseomonas algicola]NGM18838.1 ABC transporter substrate-binding protein [Falsiroseomonas algicola]
MMFGKRQLASLIGLAALPRGAAAQSAAARNRILVVGVNADPAGLEPGANRAEPIGSEVILNVFDTLVAWTPPAFAQLEGRLARSWTVSGDGKVFTFALRPGVKFHDDTACDAAAVKFSLERTRDTNPYMRATFGLIDAIEVTGPLEVRITLKEPMPVFLSLLAQPQAAIVSPAGVARHGAAFNVNPVGTGPFRFRSYRPDTDVVLDANPDYFRGAPRLQRIIYRIIPDASTRRLELENGGLDLVQQNAQLAALPTQDVRALRGRAGIEVIEVPSQIIRQLEFNNSGLQGPLRDVRVRRAITHAIDYDGLLDGVLGGTADRVYGPLPTNSWAFDPAIREMAPKYDVAQARALLAEAGVQPGQLKLTLYSFQGSLWGAVATFIQANLAAVGIEATVAQTEFPALRALHVAGRFEVALDGRQPWYNDPDAHITIGYLSGLADSAMTFRMPADAALDALILRAQTTVDFEARKQLYFQVQRQIMDRVPAAWLFSNKLIVFKRANVKGLVVNSAPPLNEYHGVFKE